MIPVRIIHKIFLRIAIPFCPVIVYLVYYTGSKQVFIVFLCAFIFPQL